MRLGPYRNKDIIYVGSSWAGNNEVAQVLEERSRIVAVEAPHGIDPSLYCAIHRRGIRDRAGTIDQAILTV